MTSTMKIYTKPDFDRILNEGFSYKLSKDVMDIIQSIADQVGSPEYIKTPQFEKQRNNVGNAYGGGNAHGNAHGNTYGSSNAHGNGKKVPLKLKMMEIADEDWESIRSFQATVLAKKEGVEASIDQIRKHLNKITNKTYDSLREKIITEIKSITTESDISSPEIMVELNKIGDSIFNIASGNSFYSTIYATLYKELMEQFAFMEVIFKNNFEKFRDLFNKIDYCDPAKDYDTFCLNNKTNEKRRALSLFYVNLMKFAIIKPNDIIRIITDLQIYILASMKNVDCKNIVEELSEVLFILITNSAEKISEQEGEEGDAWINIIDVVTEISKMKLNSYPSITNKTIFKHMDMLEAI
jgi:hypothetical protein